MSKITILRTNIEMPSGAALEGARDLLFRCLDGLGKDDKASWRRFWKRLTHAEPGEMFNVEAVIPRSEKFHRFYMGLEHSLFDSQERFNDREMLRNWLKIGSGWVVWAAGARGGVVPLPKSISFSKADENEFNQYYAGVTAFLRSGYAAKYLWPHLGETERNAMMDCIIQEFER